MNNKIFNDNLIFVWIIIILLNIILINIILIKNKIRDVKKDLIEVKEIIQRESDVDE